MSTDTDVKRLQAIARAHEVYDCLDRIKQLRFHIKQVVKNHDAAVLGNAKRDCEAFWHRLRELALLDEAKEEASR